MRPPCRRPPRCYAQLCLISCVDPVERRGASMRIETKPYGMMDIDDQQLLTFPRGLLGFETHLRWALLDSAQPPFFWLQSLEDPNLAFVLLAPAFFRPDYILELSE